MKREEYNIRTKTTYYAFWKLNKAERRLLNHIFIALGFYKLHRILFNDNNRP